MSWWQRDAPELVEYRCALCGKSGTEARLDQHHLLIARRVAMGWKKEKRGLIDHHYNLVTLCNWPCHLLVAHGWKHRVLVARQIVQYGYETLSEWVESLPFKVPFHWNMGLESDEEARKLLEEVQYDHG